MSPQAIKLLRAIAADVAEIKAQIVSLRIRVAAISATIALVVTLVTGLMFNALMEKDSNHGTTVQSAVSNPEVNRQERPLVGIIAPVIPGSRQ